MKRLRLARLFILLGILLVSASTLLPAAEHILKVTLQTIAWGYYWSAAKPVFDHSIR